MTQKIIFMFSGQGSQYYMMGKWLYENNSLFKGWMKKLDRMVSDILGETICEKIYDANKKIYDPFDRTLYSHPAIFMLEYSLAQLLLHEGIEPFGVFGVSMGEFAAAAIAGVLSLDEAIDAVVKQAIRIEEDCEKGEMYAVLADQTIFQNTPMLQEICELAAVNFNSHFVISVKKENTGEIEKLLDKHNICYEKLPVSHAFHSSLMDPAEESYKKVLNNLKCKVPNVYFFSSIYADILNHVPEVYFWEIARKPILFQRAIQGMRDQDDYLYLDLGPAGTLSNFVKYNLGLEKKLLAFPIITPFGNEKKNLQSIVSLLSENPF